MAFCGRALKVRAARQGVRDVAREKHRAVLFGVAGVAWLGLVAWLLLLREAELRGYAALGHGRVTASQFVRSAGAMAGGGLTEADQEIHEIHEIHEIEMLSLAAEETGGVISVEARWRVLGTVGHAEHLHVRGNAYVADLILEPVDGAWKLTGLTLTDVDRSEAGTTQASTEADWHAPQGIGQP